MTRCTKLALGISAFIVGVPALALIVLLNLDWNRAKPWLNARVSAGLERPFAIQGALELSWNRSRDDFPDHEASWHEAIPWPHVVARDVHVGNPASLATAPELASIGALSFALDPIALLAMKMTVPVLRFEAPRIALRRTADGHNNWTFASSTPSPWQLDLHRIALSQGTLRLVDDVARADVTAELDTTKLAPPYGVAWTLRGKFNGDPVSGSGKAGAILALQRQIAPYPIMADLKVGSTTIAVAGTLTKPSALTALDMRLKVSGASMAKLYPLIGIVLPETPHFSTEGRLSASLKEHAGHWVYEQFTGTVGASDISGRLDYQARQPRGLLTGAVHSRLLRLSDLGPLIGADSNASKKERGVNADQPSNKVLPVETFKTERWTSIDTDVSFDAEQITRDHDLPISKLRTHVMLRDGVLSLSPLNFDIAGGKMESTILLDASGKLDPPLLRAQLTASVRHLKLKQLFPNLGALQASVGEINGDASLSATGNSIASLLASSNGEIKTLINEGTISKLLLEEMGLNIGNVVLSRLFGDKQVNLNCMATDFVVQRGVMDTRSFIVDTADAVLHVSGTINLSNEQMDMTLKPESKGLRVFSLRAPLYLRGTFKQPDVSVDKGVLALRAGGALALAAAAPLAALLPLIHTGPGENSACAALLAQARIKPVAPPPGHAPAR